jgi:YHS domain-containing protein
MTFSKCELCDVETGEKCIFAMVKRVINGKEHFFCSERHADAFERKMKEHMH